MKDLEMFILMGIGIIIVFYLFIWFLRFTFGSNWKEDKDDF